MSGKRSSTREDDQPRAKRSRFSAPAEQPNGIAPVKEQKNGLASANDAEDRLSKARALIAKKAELKAQVEALKARAGANQAPKPPAPAAPAQAAASVVSQSAQQTAQPGRLPPPTSAPPAQDAKPAAPQQSFYDPLLNDQSGKRLQRRQRAGFDFVKAGTFQKEAEQQRLKAALGEDAFKKQARLKEEERREAAENAVADANLVPLGQRAAPKQPEGPVLEPIPEVEWWDMAVLANSETYEGDEQEGFLNEAKLTIYVEHPVPLEPPAEEAPPPPMPLPLTQKERKKLRTQRRVEKEKEKQELQRQGLLEPAKPKVKLSTFYRSLGAEASADPTAVERQVRADQEARIQAHEDRNLSNKLTPAERRDKKIEKLVGAAKEGEATPVSVYRVNNLESGQHRFKVKANAEELHMTGCAVITDAVSLIVVEGGQKAQKKYAHVLLNRIKWNPERDDDEDEPQGPRNECVRMWTGAVKKPIFEKFASEVCRTEAAARKFLEDRGIQHYWDLAMTKSED